MMMWVSRQYVQRFPRFLTRSYGQAVLPTFAYHNQSLARCFCVRISLYKCLICAGTQMPAEAKQSHDMYLWHQL